MIGISIKSTIGIGDSLQFSSVPENYYNATGKKLYDISKPWFFDHNPYVTRELSESLTKKIEMWNYSPKQWDWPRPRIESVYLSNAEIWANVLGVKNPSLIRPRLYRYEAFVFDDREAILIHTQGKSHGAMPDHILDHVLKKYRKRAIHIGPEDSRVNDIPHLATPTLWDLAELVSRARMLIGMDSGPAWIAACYPDVVVKKLRMKPAYDTFRTWVPLQVDNIHSHWDDRCHQIFNPSEHDIGFTQSYRRI